MSNLRFLAVRKSHGFEWESFFDKRHKTYLAICHRISASVESDSWDGLWQKIMKESKLARENKRSPKRRSNE